jgi:phosphohistidine phosphatase
MSLLKRLTLVRHAQADDQVPDRSDWERPLTKRGLRDAEEMARRLKSQRLKPDLILSSPAMRARETAEIFAKQLCANKPEKLQFADELYLADAKHLLNCIHTVGGAHLHLLIVAHNPGLTEFADQLSQERCVEAMPTCAIFTAEFALKSWDELLPATGIHVELDYPHRIA